MTFDADDVVAALSDAGVRVDRPLTEADVKRIEKKYGFTFGEFHRALLRTGLPVGDAWINWRHATPAMVRQRLDAPVEGVVFDVHNNGFWPASWGPRPRDPKAAETVAREYLADVQVLIPLYGHRYVPASPFTGSEPVLSVHQTDVIHYGGDLLDYISREFGRNEQPPTADHAHIPFWSDLALGAENEDL
ncbi:hypothetical protein ACIB24_18110 [Spongisporangium articulatum]|uniref:SMI1/KNR4 family protein n=1 Tax=Spongisporangium articulatum TaxID=3362603 RepID=A0ABW8ATQ5_9ACTN